LGTQGVTSTLAVLNPQRPRRSNVSSLNFQGQILGRVKQISIFYKLESYRVTSLHVCCIFQFSKFECEKYLIIYLENLVIIVKGSKQFYSNERNSRDGKNHFFGHF